VKDYVLSLITKELGYARQTGDDNITAKCPFHKEGQERRPSFSVNLRTGMWHCFTCHLGGGLKRFFLELGYARETVDTLLDPIADQLAAAILVGQTRKREGDAFKGAYTLPEHMLGVFDFTPKELVQAGFQRELIEDLDIGYDRQRQRITYPLRDLYGNLVGISGRLRDDDPDRGRFGKYKIYKAEMRDMGFQDYIRPSRNFLWNMDRLFHEMQRSPRGTQLVIMEGFKACMWAMQSGVYNVVGLTTSTMSAEQQEIVEYLAPEVVLFLDNDEAGIDGTWKVGRRLAMESGIATRVVDFPEYAHQPDDLIPEDLAEMVEFALPYREWKRALPLAIKNRLQAQERKKRTWLDDG
jgi:DNA primase